jgi:hypothetical protein
MTVVISRRQAVTIGAASIFTLPIIEGCNAAEWVQTALNDLPTILSIAESIIQIVAAAQGAANPGALALAQKAAAQVQSDLQLVQTLIQGYNASATKNSDLQKIDAALLDVQTNLAGIEGALHVANPAIQAAISAGVSSALVIVVALQSLIPAPSNASAARLELAKAKPANHSVTIKAGYNAALAAAGASAYQVR